jgi:phosphatidylinositol kinase/protein kinase (PI-3  family)
MTLEVLRNHSEIILTILEVLLYDPLYMWTLTADRMRKVQPTDSNRPILNRRSSTSINDTAEEAPKGIITQIFSFHIVIKALYKMFGS